jgi:magnesium transporter
MGAVQATITKDSATAPATAASVGAALASEGFFWLDVDADTSSEPEIVALLDGFHIHPLAIESIGEFGQRPKIDDYDDYVYMVVHGAEPGVEGTFEVHLVFNAHFVVTVRRGPCTAFAEVRSRLEHHHSSDAAASQIVLVYLIIDRLTDSFFPLLSAFDDQVDDLEDAILVGPTEAQLGTIFSMKRQLLTIRKVVTPERDMLAALASGVTEIPGMTTEGERYFRDLYDHLIRISDLVDSYRDLLGGVMDTHLSTVSNRLNVVMKQLAVIATIFLPLSFLTGFFGQNFAWLVGRIQNAWTFWLLGMGSEVVAVIVLMMLFKRRGWLGGPTA